MLVKLAARNVRRQIKDYVIYFITVSLTVALTFALYNLLYEKSVIAKATTVANFDTLIKFVAVAMAVITSFILGYATAFMLKKRCREFGTYLTLGMTRANVLLLFTLESLILCAASLVAGTLLGLGIYQAFMAVTTNVMGLRVTFAAYSLKGMLLTVITVVITFALSSVTSAVYLCRVRINSLLGGEKKTEKGVKHPIVWFVITVLSFAVIVAVCVVFALTLKKTLKTELERTGAYVMFFCIFMLGVAVFLFHAGLCKSLFYMCLHSKKLKYGGTNTFVLRNLGAKATADSALCGIIAFLITFAVIASNFSFTMQAYNTASIKEAYPYDIDAHLTADSKISMARADEIISKYASIKNKNIYSCYTSGNNYLRELAFKTNLENYLETDTSSDLFMTQSRFNALYGKTGTSAQVGEFAVFADFILKPYINPDAFVGCTLDLGTKLQCRGVTFMNLLYKCDFIAVVPDSCAPFLTELSQIVTYELSGDYNPVNLYDELCYDTEINDGLFVRTSDFSVREYVKFITNSNSAVMIVTALYASFTFVLMAMAVLALKTLADSAVNKTRYNVLFVLGASADVQKKALFKQTFFFFLLPFVLPLLLSIPTGIICTYIMNFFTLADAAKQVAATAVTIALIIAAVYALYFTATYTIGKQNILRRSA